MKLIPGYEWSAPLRVSSAGVTPESLALSSRNDTVVEFNFLTELGERTLRVERLVSERSGLWTAVERERGQPVVLEWRGWCFYVRFPVEVTLGESAEVPAAVTSWEKLKSLSVPRLAALVALLGYAITMGLRLVWWAGVAAGGLVLIGAGWLAVTHQRRPRRLPKLYDSRIEGWLWLGLGSVGLLVALTVGRWL
jgi:hypothetical protein